MDANFHLVYALSHVLLVGYWCFLGSSVGVVVSSTARFILCIGVSFGMIVNLVDDGTSSPNPR